MVAEHFQAAGKSLRAADAFVAAAHGAARVSAYQRLNLYVSALPHREAMPLVDRICASVGGAPGRNPVLGWDALRRLARAGVTLGAHTRTHPLLDRIEPDCAWREAVGSRADLEREVGPTPPVFAYPGGGHSVNTL